MIIMIMGIPWEYIDADVRFVPYYECNIKKCTNILFWHFILEEEQYCRYGSHETNRQDI